jgi:hypothetical protein
VIREYVGDKTLQFLKHGERASVEIDVPSVNADNGVLRVGLLGPGGEESLHATFNDVPISLKPTALQEIPLDAKLLKRQNTLVISLAQPTDNPKLALGFASVVLSTMESGR